jgi:hypothetical protein
MPGKLLNIPTEALFDMLFVILSGGLVLTANQEAEIDRFNVSFKERGRAMTALSNRQTGDACNRVSS